MENRCCFSCFVYDTLDHIGYSKRIVEFRRSIWHMYANLENSLKYHRVAEHLVVAGSKSEGSTSFYENDVDHMIILGDVICTESLDHVSNLKSVTKFQTDMKDTKPGYTRLHLVESKRTTHGRLIHRALFSSERANKYLSSAFYEDEWKKMASSLRLQHANIHCITFCEPVGPSNPQSHGSFTADRVSGILYRRPSCSQEWKRRPRRHGWPPSDVIDDIASRTCQLVPTGCKGSENQYQEWRMCFVDSEQTLMSCFNETQLKHYILFKLVTKSVLHDVSEEITSYMVKNLCFWTAESLPKSIFRQCNLLPLLLLSLRHLKNCISKRHCIPCYMIPGRNLLAEKLSPHKREQLTELLSELIAEGPLLILRCSKLRRAICCVYKHKSSEILVTYGKKRDAVERLRLYCMVLMLLRGYGKDVGNGIQKLKEMMANILFPQWNELKMFVDVDKIVFERMKEALS